MRLTQDQYFIGIAHAAALRGTCDRARVGAVIVLGDHLISTGYNGSVRGAPHCDVAGHLLRDGHCVRTIHAEQNAILFARQSIEGATVYVTHFPCLICAKLLANGRIRRVVFTHAYRVDDLAIETLRGAGVDITQVIPTS